MNKTQIQTTVAPFIALAAGYLAGSNILPLSLADWTTILTGIVGIGVILWPAVVTRAQSLKDTVGNLPATTVVTDKASADALPDNKDVVASTPAIEAAIKKAA